MIVEQMYAAGVGDGVPVRGALESAVGNGHAVNFNFIVVAFDEDGLPGEVGKGAIADVNVSHFGRVLTVTRAGAGVSQRHVDAEPGRLNLAVADENIPDVAAAGGVGLETKSVVQVGTVEGAILRENILNASRRFAAATHAAVAGLEMTVLDDEIAAGDVDTMAVPVAAGFDGNAIVAVAEVAILDEHVGAGIRIATVGVRAGGFHRDAAHGDVRAIQRRDDPHGRAENLHAFNQNVPAARGLDEIRPQEMTRAKHPVLDGHVIVAQFDDFGAFTLPAPRVPHAICGL